VTPEDEEAADCANLARGIDPFEVGDAGRPLTCALRVSICDTLAIAYPRFEAKLMARKALGLKRYGVELDPFNDERDMVVEADEEALDCMVYVRAAIEREASQTRLNGKHRYLTLKQALAHVVKALDFLEEAREG
jgi:hypothetical protein